MIKILIAALTLIALIGGQPSESIKFPKLLAPQAVPAPAPAPVPIGSNSYITQQQEQQQLDSKQLDGVKGSAPVSIAPVPVPAPAAPVATKSEPTILQQTNQNLDAPSSIQTQQLDTTNRFAPVAFPLPTQAPLAYPMTYYLVRPIPQQHYGYQQLRYAPRPEYQYVPANYHYEQSAPIANYDQAHLSQSAPIYGQAVPSTGYIRDGPIESEQVIAGADKKTTKLAKLKGSIEKALGLLSFGSYHVAKEEQFLPPQPTVFLHQQQQQQQIEQQKEFQVSQQQEQIRDLEQQPQQQQFLQQEQIREQQTPIQQQQQQQTLQNELHDWSPNRQQHSNSNQQQQHAAQDIDSNGFKRSSYVA